MIVVPLLVLKLKLKPFEFLESYKNVRWASHRETGGTLITILVRPVMQCCRISNNLSLLVQINGRQVKVDNK